MCEVQCQKEMHQKGPLAKDYANNLYQRKFYETPPYGQVQPPLSILLYIHKRGCGFLATMSVGSKTARVSPPSKRIDNAELFLDKPL
jgi:hypothetical protein